MTSQLTKALQALEEAFRSPDRPARGLDGPQGARAVKRISLSRRRIARAVTSFLVVSAMLGTASWIVAGWAEDDQTCAGCHADPPSMSSSHEKVACASCHRQGGLIGAARHAVGYTGMLFKGYVLKEEPLRQGVQPESSACLRCHSEVLDERFDEGRSVAVRHTHLLDAGFTCVVCHVGLGHRSSVAFRPQSVMERCLTCHDDAASAATCSTCPQHKPYDVTSEWRIVRPVQVGMKGSCAGCHDVKLSGECVACHGGYEMPHPAGWVEGGHMYDGFTDQPDCMLCHEPPTGVAPAPHGIPYGGYGGGFCNRCHAYPTPHGSRTRWIASHGPASKGADVAGQFCAECHGPGNLRQCGVCHSAESCKTCHRQRDEQR